MGPPFLGSYGGETSPGGGQEGKALAERGGDTVRAVPGSSESTRSYRRISGVVGKVGSAVSPQSPSGPEDPTLGKVHPVPMPRRFAPVGATTQRGLRGAVVVVGATLCIPKHPRPPYPGVVDGGIGVSHPHTSPGGGPGVSVTASPTPLQAKGRQKRVKAVADCKGDKARELTFSKGEVIVVTREEDEQSWVSVSGAWMGAGVPNLVPSPSSFLEEMGCSQGLWMGAS